MPKQPSATIMTGLALWLITGWGCATATPHPPPTVPPETVVDKAAPEAKTYTNTLTWKIASELDNFGFDVYRGEDEEGPLERINEKTIPGAGSTDALTQYSFVDDTIDPYTTYWYYVESISLSGLRERFTPVFAAKPKLSKDAPDTESPSMEKSEDSGGVLPR